MNRREFMLLTGSAGGGIALAPAIAPLISALMPVSDMNPAVLPGLESWTTTTCLMCTNRCGVKLRSVDGRMVGITGNPNHPMNAGGVCSQGMAALQMLYHPDRLLHPLGRPQGKGAGPLQQTTWEQALGQITQALKKLRDSGDGQKLAFVVGRTGGSMEALIARFMAALGSPHLLCDEAQDGYAQVFEVMHGLHREPAFDFENADLVFSFGADLLEAWRSPLQFQNSYAARRTGNRNDRVQLFVADVRFTGTAARASQWVGITPGSYGALALGIAYVMLRERLYDETFVSQYLHGFNDFRDASGTTHQGFSTLVLRDYSPEVVSRITGAPVETILALGKSFAESPAALAIFGENVVAQPGGFYAAMAIHALNLLKGNVNRPGGIYLQPTVPLKPLAHDAAANANSIRPALIEDLIQQVNTGSGVDMLFLYYSNPVYSSTFSRQFQDILRKIPLVVSFSPFPDETSKLADLVLPDAVFLERWEDSLFPTSSPASGWGIVQPCCQPAGEVRPTGDILLELAHRQGPPISDLFPWKNFQEVLQYRARGLHETQSGTICQEPFRQGLVAEMERRGWWMPDPSTFEEFWQKLTEAGAWTDPHFRIYSLGDYSGHADGKIDLYSRELKKRFPSSDLECLPHQHSGEDSPMTPHFPMVLNPYRLGRLGSGTHIVLPWILQGLGAKQELAWNSWAEIHPADARSLGIHEHDWIWVETAAGKIRIRAAISNAVAPGLVGIPCGLGHQEMGRWAQGRGSNPLSIVPPERDPVSGLSYRSGTWARMYRA